MLPPAPAVSHRAMIDINVLPRSKEWGRKRGSESKENWATKAIRQAMCLQGKRNVNPAWLLVHGAGGDCVTSIAERLSDSLLPNGVLQSSSTWFCSLLYYMWQVFSCKKTFKAMQKYKNLICIRSKCEPVWYCTSAPPIRKIAQTWQHSNWIVI